jgi:DnaK suppressor protein
MRERNLDAIRAELIARRSELLERESRVENDLKRRAEPLVSDFSDQAIQVQNDEVLEAIGKGAREEITAIDEALQRIKLGLYGICDRCGATISGSRLAVAPSVTHCATCVPIANPE